MKQRYKEFFKKTLDFLVYFGLGTSAVYYISKGDLITGSLAAGFIIGIQRILMK